MLSKSQHAHAIVLSLIILLVIIVIMTSFILNRIKKEQSPKRIPDTQMHTVIFTDEHRVFKGMISIAPHLLKEENEPEELSLLKIDGLTLKFVQDPEES